MTRFSPTECAPAPAPATLLELLASAPASDALRLVDGCAIALLPPAAPRAQAPAAAAGAAPRLRPQLRQSLLAPLMGAARMVLRRPAIRQLALRILKRSPALYTRAYQMMMASSAAPSGADSAHPEGVSGLSPRANVILRILQGAAPPQCPARPRLALVSPLPPARTGVATYAVELLAQLTRHFEIELVVAQADTDLPAQLAGLPLRSAAWFAEHGGSYDQVLYQFGNSPFHSHMFALLARHPGVVVLHDFFVGGALAHAQMSGAAPRAWSEALLHAHGYDAVRISATPAGRAQAHKDWPCSLAVLEQATRVIVHSRHARQLASDWYGAAAAQKVDVIPHPRTAPPVTDRAAARAALGIDADCFLVCSFGFVAPNKLTHELLRAWLASALHADAACALVLVGANHDSPYGVQVEQLIRSAGPGANIRIAGWTEDAVYRQYLQAADVGVQLRTNAHGESSGAVLDCMNYGLATVVNANGSMAEFPPDAVWRLPDAFGLDALRAALETLRREPARRAQFGARAVALLDAQFRPAACARQYLATLAQARADTARQHAAWRTALAAAAPADAAALHALAATLAGQEFPTQRRLLVDLSGWTPAPGGADPVTAELRELLGANRPGLRIEPVHLDRSGDAPCWRQARNPVGQLLDLGWTAQDEPVVDVHAGDIYYAPLARIALANAALLEAWRARGVSITLAVRQASDADAVRGVGADRLLCASAALAESVAASIQRRHDGL